MATFQFDLLELPPEAEALRAEVRAFLRRTAGDAPRTARALLGRLRSRVQPQVGARGWIGMTWPQALRRPRAQRARALRRARGDARRRRAGGRALDRRPAERPAAAALRHRGAAQALSCRASRAASSSFCIGMSEPDSGSDLASIRTRAERSAGGWRVNGTKIWTSGAHSSRLHDRARSARRRARRRSTRGSRSSSSISQPPGIAMRPDPRSRRRRTTSTRSSSRTPVPADARSAARAPAGSR